MEQDDKSPADQMAQERFTIDHNVSGADERSSEIEEERGAGMTTEETFAAARAALFAAQAQARESYNDADYTKAVADYHEAMKAIKEMEPTQ